MDVICNINHKTNERKMTFGMVTGMAVVKLAGKTENITVLWDVKMEVV
jgi:hypothetical protein